ncbi:MAG: hypothetical protein FWF03_01310 [Defluviitaleaceae bacterium]|nr:hypothetical protein [Defluviitaleaceae bacterium]
MTFDRSQSEFPSDFHRQVWWWAVGLVPLEVSLNDEAKAKCGADVSAGCAQWREYFGRLCDDMYANADNYLPASPRQYRDLLERISRDGAPSPKSGGIAIAAGDWGAASDRLNKSKAYAEKGITAEKLITRLAPTGLEYKNDGESAVFNYPEYPQIFDAMRLFEQSPDVRKTPARLHFAHCEFRQLFKSFNPNYDELMRRAGDESLEVARAIHEYCVSVGVKRYVHFGIIKYKHKGVRLLDYNLYGNEYPTLGVNVGSYRINPRRSDIGGLLERIEKRKKVIDSLTVLV